MNHVIADCHLVKDEAWVVCECGHRVEDPDPEHINEPFQVHRALNGEKPRRPAGITELKPPQGIESLMWRTINPNSDAQRRYKARNPEAVKAAQARYREKKRAEKCA